MRRKVGEWAESRRVGAIVRAGSIAGILLMAGCHSGNRSNSLLEGLTSTAQPQAFNLGPNHLAAAGLATITAACEKQSFESVRSGLIVSQTGLHEDVFAMRSRTYNAFIAFGLDDALKLEDVLRKELNADRQPGEQRECVQQFEGYLETLTDPLVEQDKLAKDLDASAFKDSNKEAQEELRREKEIEGLAPKK
jgi:hypothetical protein